MAVNYGQTDEAAHRRFAPRERRHLDEGDAPRRYLGRIVGSTAARYSECLTFDSHQAHT